MKVISKRPDGSVRVVTQNDGPSKTDQSFRDDCDVNTIMRRYKKTGQISHLAKSQGVFGDFSNVPDLQDALQTVTEAQAIFDQFPADLRRRFGNSPVEFYRFMEDPANVDESIKLGLRTRREVVPQPPADKPEGASDPEKKPSPKKPKADGKE